MKKAVPNSLVWRDVGSLPRRLAFPFPLATIGWHHRGNDHYRGCHEAGLEFCLRLQSETPVATDFLDGIRYDTPYPHLVIKVPGPLHVYNDPSVREAIFFIYRPELRPLLEQAGIDLSVPLIPLVMTPALASAIDGIRLLLPSIGEPGGADRADALAWLVLSTIFGTRRHRQRQRPPDIALRAFAARLQLRYSEPVDFATAAAECGMSRRTFYRKWMNLFDSTPHRYLLQIRLAHAARMLVHEDRTVAEIARACGFSGPARFCADFRAAYGTQPMRYRQEQRAEIRWTKGHPFEPAD